MGNENSRLPLSRADGDRTKITKPTKATKGDHEDSLSFFVSFFVVIVIFVGFVSCPWGVPPVETANQ